MSCAANGTRVHRGRGTRLAQHPRLLNLAVHDPVGGDRVGHMSRALATDTRRKLVVNYPVASAHAIDDLDAQTVVVRTEGPVRSAQTIMALTEYLTFSIYNGYAESVRGHKPLDIAGVLGGDLFFDYRDGVISGHMLPSNGERDGSRLAPTARQCSIVGRA